MSSVLNTVWDLGTRGWGCACALCVAAQLGQAMRMHNARLHNAKCIWTSMLPA